MVWREGSVSFALPFVSGLVLSYVFLSKFMGSYAPIRNVSLTCFIAAVCLTLFLLWGCYSAAIPTKKIPQTYLIAIASLFAILGINTFCINELGISFPIQTDKLAISSLSNIIDNIPYKNTDCNKLIKALLLGEKSNLRYEITEVFRKSGAAHILALSGLHMGVIYAFVRKLAYPLGRSRFMKIFVSLSIITLAIIYTYITGGSPSLVRACIFITLIEIAQLCGRSKRSRDIFWLGMSIQVLIWPEVVKSLGFQLSYLAVGGIYFIYPHVKDWYSLPLRQYFHEEKTILSNWKEPMRRIWEVISLSTICQLTTFPLVWYHFGYFPKYFIITNLIAIPLSSIILILSIIISLLSIIGLCPDFLIITNEAIIEFLITNLGYIADL